MNLEELKKRTQALSKAYPDYKEDFLDLYMLAVSEVEEGGSEQHECNLSYLDMLDIVKDIN